MNVVRGNYEPSKIGVPDKRASIHFNVGRGYRFKKIVKPKKQAPKKQTFDMITQFVGLTKGQGNIMDMIKLTSERTGRKQDEILTLIRGNYDNTQAMLRQLYDQKQQADRDLIEIQTSLLTDIQQLNDKIERSNQQINQISPELYQQRQDFTEQRNEIIRVVEGQRRDINDQLDFIQRNQADQQARLNIQMGDYNERATAERMALMNEMRRISEENKRYTEQQKRETDEATRTQIEKQKRENEELFKQLNRNLSTFEDETKTTLDQFRKQQDTLRQEATEQSDKLTSTLDQITRNSIKSFDDINKNIYGIDERVKQINPELSSQLQRNREELTQKFTDLQRVQDATQTQMEDMNKKIKEIQTKQQEKQKITAEMAIQSMIPERAEMATQSMMPERAEMATQSMMPERGEMATQSMMPERGEMATQSMMPERGEMATQSMTPERESEEVEELRQKDIRIRELIGQKQAQEQALKDIEEQIKTQQELTKQRGKRGRPKKKATAGETEEESRLTTLQMEKETTKERIKKITDIIEQEQGAEPRRTVRQMVEEIEAGGERP